MSKYAASHSAMLADEFVQELAAADTTWAATVQLLRSDGTWDSPMMDVVMGPIAARRYGRTVRILQEGVPAQEFRPPGGAAVAGEPLQAFRKGDHFDSVGHAAEK